MSEAVLFLIDGFEETEALTTADILRRGEALLTIVSISEDIFVTGSHGITVKADALLRDVQDIEFDMLILPGGAGSGKYISHIKLIDMIKKSYSKGAHIAAICAAPAFLGELGLLCGKKALCYPTFTEALKATGAIMPFEDNTDKNSNIKEIYTMTDGNITTSIGPGTTADFALSLLEILKGSDTARLVADGFFAGQR